MPSRRVVRLLAGIAAVALAVAVGWASLRLPPAPAPVRQPLPDRHVATTWQVEPSYAFDALCFVQLLSGDAYYLDSYEGSDDAEYARATRASLSVAERAAVDRVHWLLHDFLGTTPCTVWSALLALGGGYDLPAFRAAIAAPRAFRRARSEQLDAFYRRALGSFRLPGVVVDLALRDLGTALDALERAGFEAYWRRSVEPDLDALAGYLTRELTAYGAVTAVEGLIGGGLPSDVVHVHLARYARPNGISLGATSLVVEERIDPPQLVRVAAHEMLHDWVDWTGDAALAAWVASLREDREVARAFAARDRHSGYGTLAALAEEGLTLALEQIAAEALGAADDPYERWFFHGGGLHVTALAWYEALRVASFADDPTPVHARVAAVVASGALAPGRIADLWERTYARPCTFEAPTIGPVYLPGDPELMALDASYGDSVRPGTLVVFLRDWCAGNPGAATARLETEARRWRVTVAASDGTSLPLTPLRAGNWSTEREGRTYLYRHGLTFRLPIGVGPSELASPLRVAVAVPGEAQRSEER